MDTFTAMFADLKLMEVVNKNSQFIAESKRSPHYQRLMAGLEEIGDRTSQLSEDQLAQLARDKETIYREMLINHVSKEEDLEFANHDTIELGMLLSNRREEFINGNFGTTTKFTAPVIEVIRANTFGGTTGMRRKADGSADDTASRVYSASTDERTHKILNMDISDKKRLMSTAKVISESEAENPIERWETQQLKLEQARKVRESRAAGIKVDVGEAGSVDWASLL